MKPIIIPVDEDLYSTLEIGTKEFPLEIFFDDLSNFYQGFVNWHKQKQIEISYVLEGSVRLFTLEGEKIIQENQAFMILPDRMHSIRAYGDGLAKYITIIFDINILIGYEQSFFDKMYYETIKNSNKSYFEIIFDEQLKSLLTDLKSIYYLEINNENNYLYIQRKIQDIWIVLYNKVFYGQINLNNMYKKENVRILKMIEFLQKNYSDKFSLKKMSEYVNFSKGECCRYFKRIMGVTILQYLMEYRLKKSIELLERTDKSITQIANLVGFNSTSNYCAIFKEKIGETPRSYRKRKKHSHL